MQDNSTRSLCRSCHQETKHLILAERTIASEDFIEGHGPLTWEDTFEMLECCGCETITLRQTNYFSELPDPTVSYYPPMVSRQRPVWLEQVPRNLSSLLREVYSSLDNNNLRLALMGARTAVDLLLVDKVGDVGTFGQKLEKLENQGFVGRHNREFLETALEAGNAASHRAFSPQATTIGSVMDIIENVAQSAYVLEAGAVQIKKVTPGRKK